MNQEQVFGVLRIIITSVGGFFVGKGAISQGMLDWVAGGALTLGPAIWSFIAHRPAALAVSAQNIPGVNVQTSQAAPPAVKDAVASAKGNG